jgi:rubredoxin
MRAQPRERGAGWECAVAYRDDWFMRERAGAEHHYICPATCFETILPNYALSVLRTALAKAKVGD